MDVLMFDFELILEKSSPMSGIGGGEVYPGLPPLPVSSPHPHPVPIPTCHQVIPFSGDYEPPPPPNGGGSDYGEFRGDPADYPPSSPSPLELLNLLVKPPVEFCDESPPFLGKKRKRAQQRKFRAKSEERFRSDASTQSNISLSLRDLRGVSSSPGEASEEEGRTVPRLLKSDIE